MPVHKVVLGVEGVDANAVEVFQSAKPALSEADATVRFSDLSLTPSREGKEQLIVESVQEELDNRQLLSGLPSDDPDKTINPAQDNLYWGYADGTPVSGPSIEPIYLIGRGVVCTGAPWNSELNRYDIQLRRSHDGPIGA